MATNQPKDYKPSLSSILSTTKSYNFEVCLNGNYLEDTGPFIGAYVLKNMKDWAKAICPNALFGKDYSALNSYVKIEANFYSKPRLYLNGCWKWKVVNLNIIFYVGEPVLYKYVYSMPDMIILGNDIKDPTLYNNMLEYIDRHIYK